MAASKQSKKGQGDRDTEKDGGQPTEQSTKDPRVERIGKGQYYRCPHNQYERYRSNSHKRESFPILATSHRSTANKAAAPLNYLQASWQKTRLAPIESSITDFRKDCKNETNWLFSDRGENKQKSPALPVAGNDRQS
jgi:hypothetical protein